MSMGNEAQNRILDAKDGLKTVENASGEVENVPKNSHLPAKNAENSKLLTASHRILSLLKISERWDFFATFHIVFRIFRTGFPRFGNSFRGFRPIFLFLSAIFSSLASIFRNLLRPT